MTQITLDTSKGQLLAFTFGQDALAASQTDVQLPTAIGESSQAVDGYLMPFDYDIVAISAATSVAATVGTLTVGATVNGTEDADTTMTITTQTNLYKRVGRDKAKGGKNTRLGAEITTGGTWDGTTADLVVTVFVIAYLDGI